MIWEPISDDDVSLQIDRELKDCSEALQAFFATVRIDPAKWAQSPWGDEGGGFWAVAIHEDRVLWYNDIENGFNVSRFVTVGRIPDNEYWCNQDKLCWALRRLEDESNRGGWKPPEPQFQK